MVRYNLKQFTAKTSVINGFEKNSRARYTASFYFKTI